MKLSDALESSYFYSGKASDISRQLAFAGIATIWIFKKSISGQTCIPNELYAPLLYFIIALSMDILQYVVGTIIWTLFHRYYEKKMSEDDDEEIKANPLINWPNWLLFFGKIVFVITGYINLIIYLKDQGIK